MTFAMSKHDMEREILALERDNAELRRVLVERLGRCSRLRVRNKWRAWRCCRFSGHDGVCEFGSSSRVRHALSDAEMVGAVREWFVA